MIKLAVPKISMNIYRRSLNAKPLHKSENVWLVPSRTLLSKTYTVRIMLRADFWAQVAQNDSCPASGFDYLCTCAASDVRGLCHHALAVKRQAQANHGYLFLAVSLPMTATYRGENGFYSRIEQILKSAPEIGGDGKTNEQRSAKRAAKHEAWRAEHPEWANAKSPVLTEAEALATDANFDDYTNVELPARAEEKALRGQETRKDYISRLMAA